MAVQNTLQPSPIPYYNLEIDRGYTFKFSVDAIDRSTGQVLDLSNCIATLTACTVNSVNPLFFLDSTGSNISLDVAHGVVNVTIPYTVTDSVYWEQAMYDLVVTDQFFVSTVIVRGMITLNWAA